MSFNQTMQLLSAFAEFAHTMSGDDLTLGRMYPLLEKIGNPQQKLKVIHIAGTSGKTSTAYYCSALLSEAGFKVGLTVSPHIDSITERIQINLTPISEKEFARAFAEFYSIAEKPRPSEISYFELLVAFELWYFVQVGVDYAVVETGMGGLLDATNVVTSQDKVCLITDIGFDHMHVLGNTLPEIAFQKAGIMHKSNHVFLYKQATEIDNVFRKQSLFVGAHLHHVQPVPYSTKQNIPEFLQRNFRLAYSAVSYVAKRDGFPVPTIDSSKIVIPARMEKIKTKNGDIIIDGAHNEQKIGALVASLQILYPNVKFAMLVAFKQGKEYERVLKLLAPIAFNMIVTTFSAKQDMPIKSCNPHEVADYAASLGIDTKVVIDPYEACELLLENSGFKLITGSFYMIGLLRTSLKNISIV